MELSMKSEVTENFPYGLNKYNDEQIKQLGLKIIATIETDNIKYKSEEINTFFKGIGEKCKESHVWVLFGSNDENDKKIWLPFQAASRTADNVVNEIKKDFLCMTPHDEKQDMKVWNSYFYNSVMNIEYGLDSKCQKYRKIREMCLFFAIAILEDESSLEEINDGSDISKYQKAECDIALKLKPLLWNPAGKEYTYLKLKNNSDLS